MKLIDTAQYWVNQAYEQITMTQPRPSLHPIPGSKPLILEAALLPPLLYYVALLFLPPLKPSTHESIALKFLRNTIALIAGILFLRLPLVYHVPQSIGLTYQLGLVGMYGFTRVIDAFFISAMWFGHIPRRVKYTHETRPETPMSEAGDEAREREWTDGGVKDPWSDFYIRRKNKKSISPPPPEYRKKHLSPVVDPSAPQAMSTSLHTPIPAANQISKRRESATETASYFLRKTLSGPRPTAVTEHAITEPDFPHGFQDRASWALELELSMRGTGFAWQTADIRHTKKTWLPTVANRLHSILIHVLPVSLGAWYIISSVYTAHLASTFENDDYNPFANPIQASIGYKVHRPGELFDSLPVYQQLLLTMALGAFLMSAFSLGHSIFAIMLHPLSPHPLAFFPPLYTTRVWSLTSVRAFWSFGWHRLFARLFLVWGVWPGEWLERTILRKSADAPADVGKVIGAFVSSAVVHAFSVRGVLAGRWTDAAGEMRFFLLNGVAVVLEGIVQRGCKGVRRRMGWPEAMWYDAWIGRAWWISAVVWSGREFSRGWLKSGLVREMAFR